MNLKDLAVFFLDLQTTGAKPGAAHILEVAWAHEDVLKSSLAQQPEQAEVPRRIQMLTGISQEDMATAQELSHIFSEIQPLTKQVCVIHFAQFERPFLEDCFARNLISEFPVLCTHKIAKRLLPNLPAKGIKGLAGYFGFNAGEFKRAATYVEATQVIWKNLLPLLAEAGVHTYEDLQTWLQGEAPKKTKYEYPMAKEKRLGLPKQAGVYRMISQWGEVLYVGKATSLRDRVNSYFRGQKNRDHRKLEMLTQAWDLRVTPCRTPLEAALLETDEIKKYNPRYNISLKAGQRSLVFFNRDFDSLSFAQDEVHSMGPFSHVLVLDSVTKLSQALRQQQDFDTQMFFEEFPVELLHEGFALFCQRHQHSPRVFASMRSILAFGMWMVRKAEAEAAEQADISEEDSDELDILAVEAEEEPEDVPLTPEDMADKFARHFRRAAHAYRRARRLTRLLNSDVEYRLNEEGVSYHLQFAKGQLLEAEREREKTDHLPWQDLSIETYDRMSVLYSELERVRSRAGSYITRALRL